MPRLSLILTALLFFEVPSFAQDTPQVCYDGVEQLRNLKQYSLSVKSLTSCIDTGVLSTPVLVVALHDRSVARFLEWYGLPDDNIDSSYELLELALDDADRAIDLNPDYGAAYCQRGNVIYNLSWGTAGFEDIDKGRSLGESDDECYLLD